MRRAAMVGVLAAVAVAAVACQGDTGTRSGSPPASSPTAGPAAPPSSPAPSAEPSSTAVTPTPATSTPAPSTPTPATSTPATSTAVGVLREGDRGPAVLALQRRLAGMGYWLGTPDGSYGGSTRHAVTAFQKAAGLARDGVAGPVTLAALDRAARLRPRSTTGRVVEIDLRRQLLLVTVGGQVQWVMDTSTGSVPGTTPTGRFTVLRQVDGYDAGPLGVLYRPKYFVGGVAVHGYPSVPPYPASHGCVRVSNAAMDWLWANHVLPIGAAVWVY